MSTSAIIVAGNDVQVILDALATAGTLSKYFPDASDEVVKLSRDAINVRARLIAQPIIREDFESYCAIERQGHKEQTERVREAIIRAVTTRADIGSAFR